MCVWTTEAAKEKRGREEEEEGAVIDNIGPLLPSFQGGIKKAVKFERGSKPQFLTFSFKFWVLVWSFESKKQNL